MNTNNIYLNGGRNMAEAIRQSQSMNVQIQGGYEAPSAAGSMAMRMKQKKDQMITSG